MKAEGASRPIFVIVFLEIGVYSVIGSIKEYIVLSDRLSNQKAIVHSYIVT